ncbi:interleukin-36 beta [Tupaia chinensis]|uniref:interleukin-36 beta n=1 Tax=Tupaia chinensis TaxID=246437 RepID=UPI0007044192|nr:interleukin-36 beta [Tupaia chinensis]
MDALTVRRLPSYYHIRDTQQMVWVLNENSLIAAPLTNNIKPVRRLPSYYHIRDTQQMVWVLNENSLIAAPLTNNIKPVTIEITECKHAEFYDEGKGNLVYMGIKGKGLCLFCTETQGKPTLQLEAETVMSLYDKDNSEKPFLFYHNKEGSTSVFQSVSYPGWFIANSSTPREPVILTQERGTNNNTNFYLEAED